MSEGLQGIIILISISFLCSVISHWQLKNFKFAIGAATLVSISLFQLANYFHLGYLDPFIIIALITSSFFALIIAILVGCPFYFVRRKRSV
tara:strand:- start:771 stop:1043 length:273 start_codon:yes stop_codon:yes gene_type:complete